MADLRITGAQPLTPAPLQTRGEAVKAAQRAFFDAALAQVQASAPSGNQAQASFARSAETARAAFNAADGAAPSRLMRPGSLLDIKV